MPIDRTKELGALRLELQLLEADAGELLKRLPIGAAGKVAPLLARTIAIIAALIDLADSNLEGKTNGQQNR